MSVIYYFGLLSLIMCGLVGFSIITEYIFEFGLKRFGAWPDFCKALQIIWKNNRKS